MSDLVRFSVSIESELLEGFDRLIGEGKLATRSEAVRQLIREKLTETALGDEKAEVAATLTLIYDHHKTSLTDKLLDIQHSHTDRVVATLHVHLEHDACMEVIVLRGPAVELQELASELGGLKGIHQAQLVVARAVGDTHTQPRGRHKHKHG